MHWIWNWVRLDGNICLPLLHRYFKGVNLVMLFHRGALLVNFTSSSQNICVGWGLRLRAKLLQEANISSHLQDPELWLLYFFKYSANFLSGQDSLASLAARRLSAACPTLTDASPATTPSDGSFGVHVKSLYCLIHQHLQYLEDPLKTRKQLVSLESL